MVRVNWRICKNVFNKFFRAYEITHGVSAVIYKASQTTRGLKQHSTRTREVKRGFLLLVMTHGGDVKSPLPKP